LEQPSYRIDMSILSAERPTTQTLTTACAWCGSVLVGGTRWTQPRQPLPRTGITHGICPTCYVQVQAERLAAR
jgi:hypothetical protein